MHGDGAGDRPGALALALALALPVLALGLQWLAWDWIAPFVWFLFYPAVFLSARLGGLRGGLPAAALSVLLVWYFFVPPRLSWDVAQPTTYASMVLFLVMGALFGVTHDSLRRTRRASDVRFEATFDHAAVGIALVSPDGRWLRVNRKLCEIVGYDADEMRARTFRDLTHPADLGRSAGLLRQMLAGETDHYEIQKRYVRKDGSAVWVQLTVSLVRTADRRPDYLVAVIEDVQARKEAEAALQEAKRLAGLGHWHWDLRAGTHFWSPEVYEFYGRDPALPPAVYPEVSQYFTPAGWARLQAAVEQGMATGVPYECDAEVVRPDGSTRWVTARGEALRDAAGEVVVLRGTVQDITARKAVEEEIRRLNTDLERRVAERTAELTAANRELDAFAYAVSHDLRAPLRAMSGFSHALVEDHGDRLEGTARDYLDQIVSAARRMGDLIDGLLSLSRTTRGDLRRERVDVSAMATRLLEELAREEPGRRVETVVEPGLAVQGDAVMVEVILRNLLGNAWKYTARKEAPSIRVRSEDRGGRRWIGVADDGAGFDMDHAGKLFQAFQRLHRQDEFPGIGIGLATVHRIVQRHGGAIEAQGKPGGGAVFRFALPEGPAGEAGMAGREA